MKPWYLGDDDINAPGNTRNNRPDTTKCLASTLFNLDIEILFCIRFRISMVTIKNPIKMTAAITRFFGLNSAPPLKNAWLFKKYDNGSAADICIDNVYKYSIIFKLGV